MYRFVNTNDPFLLKKFKLIYVGQHNHEKQQIATFDKKISPIGPCREISLNQGDNKSQHIAKKQFPQTGNFEADGKTREEVNEEIPKGFASAMVQAMLLSDPNWLEKENLYFLKKLKQCLTGKSEPQIFIS